MANFLTIANTNRDLTGINIELTNVNDRNDAVLYCIQGTFTGFHRVYTEDEKFNIEDPQTFKNDYEGRIVVSTGKIATDTTDDNDNKDNTEWRILYDKEGITIEDALPKIELSRIRKDKRVFAVSASVFAVSACVFNVCVSVFICCNSDLYVVDTCRPEADILLVVIQDQIFTVDLFYFIHFPAVSWVSSF